MFFLQVQVSLDACSNCEGMLELPEIITAWYKGRHTSVLLPGNTVVRVRSQREYYMYMYLRTMYCIINTIAFIHVIYM